MNNDYTQMDIDIELRKDFNREQYSLTEILDYADGLKKKSAVILNGKKYRIREIRVSDKRYNYIAVVVYLYPDNNIEIDFEEKENV